MDSLTGTVERITFYNPENGYTVLRLRPDGGDQPWAKDDDLVTVAGNLPEIGTGEYLKLEGQWTTHPKYGPQFSAETCERVLPASVDGIRRYLASGLLVGIGPKLAERIVDHFGADTLDVIEKHPEKLRQVPDIGPKRTKQIVAAWEEQKQVKDIMLFLHGHGVSTNLALKIYKQYGDQALHIVQENPYQLARDIYGVGFKTADKIARALGLPADHPTRIEAGVIYALEEMNNDGHVFAPQDVLTKKSAELLGVEPDLVPPAIGRLAAAELIFVETMDASEIAETVEAVYPTPYYYAERGVAERLRALASASPSRLSDISHGSTIADPNLSSQQTGAIRLALTHPVSVLTGGPGTGKTTAIQALIAAVESAGKRYALASPTGRAAKRLSEAANRPASTIHRLLEYSPAKGWGDNADNPLPVDLLVVDEASMLDLILANHLLKALQPGTHLLLVGDVDQLPSVGAGDVLRDVIKSGLVPVTRLTEIFRQAAGSHIITNAHRINQGEQPEFPKQSDDFFLFKADDPIKAADWVEDLVVERIPRKFGLRPREDVQVIVPMYRGPAGVHALNARLQSALNPASALKPERQISGQTFRAGDKLMQVRNDYDKSVFNGDIGLLRDISQQDHTLTVEFDGRGVTYDWSEADQLVLAYAISVHKSQGSEFPAIVLPLLTHHYMMLQRNLLYTAITRAKKLCVLIGNRKTIAIAVKNNKVADRYSALAWRLQQAESSIGSGLKPPLGK